MLILAILTLAAWLIDFVIGFVYSRLPFGELPETILNYVEQFFNILAKGVDLFGFLIGPVGKTLLAIVISLEAFYSIWKIVWFVIRKIKLSE